MSDRLGGEGEEREGKRGGGVEKKGEGREETLLAIVQ